jgi:ribosomal protein L1
MSEDLNSTRMEEVKGTDLQKVTLARTMESGSRNEKEVIRVPRPKLGIRGDDPDVVLVVTAEVKGAVKMRQQCASYVVGLVGQEKMERTMNSALSR